MTLIERLRATEVREVRVVTNRTAIVKECEVPINPDGPEAADRIEALEAALQRIAKRDYDLNNPDLWPSTIARKALGAAG